MRKLLRLAGWKVVAALALAATVYHVLGLDSEMTVPDQLGRPVHVCHGGRPVEGVLA